MALACIYLTSTLYTLKSISYNLTTWRGLAGIHLPSFFILWLTFLRTFRNRTRIVMVVEETL